MAQCIGASVSKVERTYKLPERLVLGWKIVVENCIQSVYQTL